MPEFYSTTAPPVYGTFITKKKGGQKRSRAWQLLFGNIFYLHPEDVPRFAPRRERVR
jgi:hypothetical protein